MTPERLKEVLEGFGALRLAVFGDLMLDEYVWGDVARISPDAPVQVVEIRRRSQAIGGAANVAHNIVSGGGSADLFGLVGNDRAGGDLVDLLQRARVDTQGVQAEDGRTTTVKTRVVARGQHLVRLDEERKTALGADARARLLRSFSARAAGYGAVLLSDYAKGMIDPGLIADVRSELDRIGSRAPLVVDPKVEDFSRYRGCTAITPNLMEAEMATRMRLRDESEIREAAARIRDACGAAWVLITRGEKGMAVSGPDGTLTLISALAREVYDVTGAGDTVLAYFAMGLACGVPGAEAAEVANLAAGVKIGKVGTAPVGPSEIVSWHGGGRGPGKIAGLSEAAARLEHARARGKQVVFTNGCFDLLHAGHVHLLERARALGDMLVVAVNSDDSIRRLKGEGRPLVGVDDRVRVLSALDVVDLVVVFDEDTPLSAIREIRPDVLVKGGDYSIETIVGHDLVLGWGGRVETIPLVEGRSTSRLIASIKKSGET